MADLDAVKCREQLAHIIAKELITCARRFASNKIRGLAIDCHPWHKVLELCLCTDLDDQFIEENGKWWLADWRYFQFTRTVEGNKWPATQALCEAMFDYCEENNSQDDFERRTGLVVRICAQALLSPTVKEAIKNYDLADDFEFFVSHPDELEENLCQSEARSRSF